MKKRSLAILVTLCLVFSLAACSSSGSSASQQAQEPAAAEGSETPPESSEPMEEPDESSEENAEAPEGDESGLRPAKMAEDPIFDEDTQELMSYIAKAISDEYLAPNGISAEDFVWPTDPTAWVYFNGDISNGQRQIGLLDQIYSEIAIGVDDLVDEALIPASPDKEIMDAVAHGITSWLQQFESVESGYLDHLFVLLKDSQYLMDNVIFE